MRGKSPMERHSLHKARRRTSSLKGCGEGIAHWDIQLLLPLRYLPTTQLPKVSHFSWPGGMCFPKGQSFWVREKWGVSLVIEKTRPDEILHELEWQSCQRLLLCGKIRQSPRLEYLNCSIALSTAFVLSSTALIHFLMSLLLAVHFFTV